MIRERTKQWTDEQQEENNANIAYDHVEHFVVWQEKNAMVVLAKIQEYPVVRYSPCGISIVSSAKKGDPVLIFGQQLYVKCKELKHLSDDDTLRMVLQINPRLEL